MDHNQAKKGVPMYSESDLQDAVAAGILTPQSVQALRDHVATLRASPVVDEEQFRLLTGFNDIFVSIASLILLVAVAWLGNSLHFGTDIHAPSPASGLLVAAASWALAEYFTRQRHMALPSILLLLGFVGGVGLGLMALVLLILPNAGEQVIALAASGVALITTFAAWLHWRRFMVPITVAAGATSAAGIVLGLLLWAVPAAKDSLFWLLLFAGLAIFAFAMHWDMSDRARQTRRSDVAFWLHLAAAPMIAHSMFQILGVFNGQIGIGKACTVIALYIAFGLVALAVDRRALLVSSLAYVLFALYALFQQVGAVELSAAFTALVIGSALLLLSALWHSARTLVVNGLPQQWAARLPYVDRAPT
jgi:LPXTG-motif cell wall-anchored protein